MHHFVFRTSYDTKSPMIKSATVRQHAPLAKIYDKNSDSGHFLQHYFKLIDSSCTYAVIEVEDPVEAEQLMLRSDRLADGSSWRTADLIYIFHDIKRDSLDRDAILMKLDDSDEYTEDRETIVKAANMKSFARKFNAFWYEAARYSTSYSPEVKDMIDEAMITFNEEYEQFKVDRKKAKAEATKMKKNFKNRLLKYAIHKNG